MISESRLGNIEGITDFVRGLSVYPLLLLLSLYATWALAWIEVGHQPIPMMDRPKALGIPVGIFYRLTWYLIIGLLPVFVMNAFLLIIELLQRLLHKRYNVIGLITVPGVSWSALIAVLKWNPVVVNWFLKD
jgi:hypothetical protein